MDSVLWTRPARPNEITAANGYRFTKIKGEVDGYTLSHHMSDGSGKCLGTIIDIDWLGGEYRWRAWHRDDMVGEFRTRREAAAALDSFDSYGRVK